MPRATGLALALALTSTPAEAQLRAGLDAGVSHVEYDGFLPSAAFSLAPSLLFVGQRAAFAAQGTWLRFESGNNSFQGLLAGSFSNPTSTGLTTELGAEIGGSRYIDVASFSHVLARARVRSRAAWLAAVGGVVNFGAGSNATLGLSGGLQHDLRDVTLGVSGAATAIGTVTYADFGTSVRHGRPGSVMAEAVLSARAGDPEGEAGPYMEGSLTLPLTRHAAVVIAGGRYAADVVRGTVGGRYVTAAIRLTAPLRPRRRPPLVVPLPPVAEDGATAAVALVAVRRGRGESCTLVFRAPSAVELMGDFTDWVPTRLERTGRDQWSVTLPIPPGRHRLNVRLNGGAWVVPVGATPVTDDFLGLVGAVVIP